MKISCVIVIILTLHTKFILSTTDLSQQPTQQTDRLATFSLKFLEFHNHAHRRIDGSCCGRPRKSTQSSLVSDTKTETCKAECALEFRICIEPYTASVLPNNSKVYNGPCIYGEARTGHWGNTDITYGLLEANIHSIGITHPWPNSGNLILSSCELMRAYLKAKPK
ncbi:Protein jagged-1 isoform 2 [Schistosoma japonicum]|uniref:Protein jagged-1 isoform 2 n=1 Tax=Schistosoma japonicum TaxID=6182 RepID=A0A4Z2D7U5_SCHJA|nr:Protein jagged-1 isoform 2 [Schistosoma japonicum]